LGQNVLGSDVGRWDSADSLNLRYFIEFIEPGQSDGNAPEFVRGYIPTKLIGLITFQFSQKLKNNIKINSK